MIKKVGKLILFLIIVWGIFIFHHMAGLGMKDTWYGVPLLLTYIAIGISALAILVFHD